MADEQFFKYQGIDPAGAEKTGTIEAETEAAALGLLRDSGISVTRIKATRPPQAAPRRRAAPALDIEDAPSYTPQGTVAAAGLYLIGAVVLLLSIPIGIAAGDTNGAAGMFVVVSGVIGGLMMIGLSAVINILNDIATRIYDNE